jgi:PAS domain S-box-containing protein
MASTASSDPLIRAVDDVLITAELASRPSRSPDYEAEGRALGHLAQEMATSPGAVLQECAKLVMKLCHADSAGISILEPGGTNGILRWHAAAGRFAPNLHGAMPREASPCGTVMERNCVLLFNEAERFFPALRGVEPRIHENLLAPWHVKGKAGGTLWAIKHTPEGRFDAEDARLLQSLARFAAAAFQTTSALDEATAERSALRESEDRQAFLLQLSDALRPLDDASEIQATTTRLLGEHLGADRSMYGEVEGERGAEVGTIRGQYVRPALEGEAAIVLFPERFAFKAFGAHTMAARYRGETLVVGDVEADPAFDAPERVAWIAAGVRAAIVATLVKGGRLVAELGVHSARPRAWSEAEVALVREVGERTWAAAERARAEAALRESEERFRQFAHAAAEGAWIRDARALDMEYVSPAASRIYGAEPQALLDGVQHWAGLIVPEDRDLALARLEEARRGQVVVSEFRIQRPSDGAFRWIRSTDFPLFDAQGGVQRVGGLAEDVTDAKLAAEHSAVLLAELQHRVRNIMALLRSITNRTGERAASVAEYRDLMMGRLMAFARVQALLTRTASVSVGIASIVRDEVSVQAQHEGQYDLDGPDTALSPKAAEVLTLAIHELATNAVKYGALSVPDGKVRVRWSTFEKRGAPWLAFDWTEEGAPTRPQPASDTPRRGFGSELIEGRIPYELRGRGHIVIELGGARCHLEFPLQAGASILETGAPQRATVFGGAIDMTGEHDLTGRRVLVVEDDYYLATDAARALRGAGADVMGPCGTEEDARAELEEQRPDAAVVDINLGPGSSFKLAQALKDRGIPFVFATGYDAGVIPEEFEGVDRLEKPLQLRRIVDAVAKLTTAV